MLPICVSAILSLVAWLPAHAALDDTAKLHFAWVTPALVAGALSCGFLAIMCFSSAHWAQEAIEANVDELMEEMNGMPLNAAKAIASS